MRPAGLFSALLAAVHLRAAAGLAICGAQREFLRPCTLRGGFPLRKGGGSAEENRRICAHLQMCATKNGFVNKDSTLAELRVYVKENGLEVKTAGPGRNKEAILSDILRLQGTGAPAALQEEPGTAVEEETVATPPTSKPPAPADAEVATEAAADATPNVAPPDGFTWGATF